MSNHSLTVVNAVGRTDLFGGDTEVTYQKVTFIPEKPRFGGQKSRIQVRRSYLRKDCGQALFGGMMLSSSIGTVSHEKSR